MNFVVKSCQYTTIIRLSHLVSMIICFGWWVGIDAGGGKSNVSERLFAFFEGWQFFFLLLPRSKFNPIAGFSPSLVGNGISISGVVRNETFPDHTVLHAGVLWYT